MFRPVLALAGAGLWIALACPQPPADAAVAGTSGASAPDGPAAEVTISSFTPAAPKPGDTVTVSGTVTNTGTVTLSGPTAGACIHKDPLANRTALGAVPKLKQPDEADNSCDGLTELGTFAELGETLEPARSTSFQVKVPWNQWQVGDHEGVYVVGIRVRVDPTDGSRARKTVGISRTVMPVVKPVAGGRKVNVAMVLPVQHQPTVLAGTVTDNESLGESVSQGGRLSRLVQAGAGHRVSWLVDPSVLDEAKLLADGYQVRTTPGRAPATGAYQQAAADWLTGFDTARGANPVVFLPYADPDVAGLVEHNVPHLVRRARTLTAENIAAAQKAGWKGSAPVSGYWLDPAGAGDRTLAATATGRPNDLGIVSSWAWPVTDRPTLTPSPVVTVPAGTGTSRVVVNDAALTAGGPDDGAASAIQVRQRFIAETALLARGTGPAATVVAVPPRGFDPDGTATATLMTALDTPWVNQVGLDAVLRAAAPRPARALPDTQQSAQSQLKRPSPQLSENQLRDVVGLARGIATYGSLVDSEVRAATTDPPQRPLLRTASNAWRSSPAAAQRFTGYQLGIVDAQLGKVHLLGTDPNDVVTLSGRTGQFPVTIANDLDRTVTVGLTFESVNRDDLRIEPLQPKRIPPRQKATYFIKASAQQNGLIKARAQVVSADDVAVSQPTELNIQANSYGSVGWILVGGAVAALFGTSLIRIYRRIRTERRNGSAVAREAATEGADG